MRPYKPEKTQRQQKCGDTVKFSHQLVMSSLILKAPALAAFYWQRCILNKKKIVKTPTEKDRFQVWFIEYPVQSVAIFISETFL